MVPQASLLRVYLAPHRLDVDLRLERAGHINASRAAISTEEVRDAVRVGALVRRLTCGKSLVAVLDPGVQYDLKFLFFDLELVRRSCEVRLLCVLTMSPFPLSSPCYVWQTFNLEFAVVPLAQLKDAADTPCAYNLGPQTPLCVRRIAGAIARGSDWVRAAPWEAARSLRWRSARAHCGHGCRTLLS
jgi:hypothetical protein